MKILKFLVMQVINLNILSVIIIIVPINILLGAHYIDSNIHNIKKRNIASLNINKVNDLLSSYKLSFNKHFFNENIFQSNYNIPSNDTKYACLSYFDNLARISSAFTRCVINNSRPFHLCQNCAEYYLQVKDTYNLIITVNIKKIFFA